MNGYIFDNSANDRFRSNEEELLLAIKSVDNGFKYFYIDTRNEDVGTKLSAEPLRPYVSFLPDYLKADGFCLVPPSSEPKEAFDMFMDIAQPDGNPEPSKYNDADVARLAISYDCIIVSDDNYLIGKVNKYYPDKALKYCDFIALLKR